MTRRIALPLLADEITGAWTFRVERGGQSGSPKFIFQQKGTGTITSPTEKKGQAEGTWTAKKN